MAIFLVEGLPATPPEQRFIIARHVVRSFLPCADVGRIDAFSDIEDLPEDVAASLSLIRSVAPFRRERGRNRREQTMMNIGIDLANAAQREAFISFAPYSIHAELGNSDGSQVELDDASTSIELSLTPSVATELTAAFDSIVRLRRLR